MKKRYFLIFILAALLILTALAATFLSGCSDRHGPLLFDDTLPMVCADLDTHIRVSAAGEPQIVYAPYPDSTGYRYGPSIMYYADGSCDAWFSSNGNLGEWDWITARHSKNGVNFDQERIVLTPTPDSRDLFSCCDPGAVYFGGYYYLGYTSTIEEGGVCNNVFVARSKTVEGPYEKWNGSGWGGDPSPIIYYDENDKYYGAGEPSFVVVDDTLYIYYTWACPDGDCVRVATSDTGEDWPARLVYRGVAYVKSGNDSMDVAYVEDVGKFIGVTTLNRMTERSGIAITESDDGLHFKMTDFICEGFYQYCHSSGISRRPDGHVQLKDDIFIGYAFSNGDNSKNWGRWATAFQRVKLELYQGEVTESPPSVGIFRDNYFADPEGERPVIGISASELIIELYSGGSEHTVYTVKIDPAALYTYIDGSKDVKFYGYDQSLIRIKGNVIRSENKAGMTVVRASYKGHETLFKVFVHDSFPDFRNAFNKTVEEFTPRSEEYRIRMAEGHCPQIRGYARFSDNTWGETGGDAKMINYKKFPITYEVEDETVAVVNERGIITPLFAGETAVKVSFGEKSFTVMVIVTE